MLYSFSDGLSDIVMTKVLDWALVAEPGGLNVLEAWEAAVYGECRRAELILGADIVSPVRFLSVLHGVFTSHFMSLSSCTTLTSARSSHPRSPSSFAPVPPAPPARHRRRS